jgi:hypothetical protein
MFVCLPVWRRFEATAQFRRHRSSIAARARSSWWEIPGGDRRSALGECITHGGSKERAVAKEVRSHSRPLVAHLRERDSCASVTRGMFIPSARNIFLARAIIGRELPRSRPVMVGISVLSWPQHAAKDCRKFHRVANNLPEPSAFRGAGKQSTDRVNFRRLHFLSCDTSPVEYAVFAVSTMTSIDAQATALPQRINPKEIKANRTSFIIYP